ncbi:hypothetical protein GH714_026175 [Hevea brasiliensis]|uniref:Hexosyltransferase n=1 Tax=Hevea brasiliensis TaxID=3981 RepID=A0A6A6NJ77_HEVBR|nr:hypothetical protein GH714_026175 [Hevea brasiliensis]
MTLPNNMHWECDAYIDYPRPIACSPCFADGGIVKKNHLTLPHVKRQSNQSRIRHHQNLRIPARRETNDKVKEMKDQLIRAKAYLSFAPPGSNSHLVKELRLRMKELERAMGEVMWDADLSRSALKKMKSMEVSLSKASRVFPHCSAMVTKLRAMTYGAEEQVQAQKNQTMFLIRLAARTTPKGLHCLSMQLTAQFFALPPEERQFPNQQRLHDAILHHYAVFSDNILACAVVVNSTVSSAKDAEKIVFHVVTDSLNFPAISMWFLLNPPSKATIHIQNIDNFDWLSAKYNSTLKQQNSRDPRYASALNHLRFYLPDIFPLLNKIVFLDHDVVVQKDLTGLWSLNMKGKVNGAVETCKESEASFRQMDLFINFSDPYVTKRFDAKACTWAFGMNLFDLKEWRRRKLTALYHKYLQVGYKKPLWKAGSLPLGWATFYNQTVILDRNWHRLGLGYDFGIRQDDIDRAAVLHYDGVMKPWLDIGLPAMALKGKVRCEKPFVKENGCNKGMTASLFAAVGAATMSSPTLALVDERMSTEGTGLPFGLSNNLLGWILLGVFGLIWAFYIVYTSTLDEDDDSGLSL